MKKFVLLLLCLLVVMLCACGQAGGTVVVTTHVVEAGETAAASESVIQETASPSSELSPSVSVSPVASDAPEMYTSYAHMTAFDPSSNIASFDYFDMLRGEDAVKWLVDQVGYSQADAEALVADYADSEYIEKNTNPQLREVDLSVVPVTLIVNDDGTLPDEFASRVVSIDSFKAMYTANSKNLLEPFFYEVKVDSSGDVESVNQVYWP